jgi:hypothetical protein
MGSDNRPQLRTGARWEEHAPRRDHLADLLREAAAIVLVLDAARGQALVDREGRTSSRRPRLRRAHEAGSSLEHALEPRFWGTRFAAWLVALTRIDDQRAALRALESLIQRL